MLLRRGSLAEFGHLPLLAAGRCRMFFCSGSSGVMAGRGVGGAKPKHKTGRSGTQSNITNLTPPAPRDEQEAAPAAARRRAPSGAARPPATPRSSAFSSLMILAHKLMNPKQSPSPFWKSSRKMFCWTFI